MEQEEWPGMSLNKIVAPSSCRQLYNFPIFDSLPSLSSRRPTPARSPSIICRIPVTKAVLRVLGAVGSRSRWTSVEVPCKLAVGCLPTVMKLCPGIQLFFSFSEWTSAENGSARPQQNSVPVDRHTVEN